MPEPVESSDFTVTTGSSSNSQDNTDIFAVVTPQVNTYIDIADTPDDCPREKHVNLIAAIAATAGLIATIVFAIKGWRQ